MSLKPEAELNAPTHSATSVHRTKNNSCPGYRRLVTKGDVAKFFVLWDRMRTTEMTKTLCADMGVSRAIMSNVRTGATGLTVELATKITKRFAQWRIDNPGA